MNPSDTVMDAWQIDGVYDERADMDFPLAVAAVISAASGPAVQIGSHVLSPWQAEELLRVVHLAIVQCARVRTGGAA